MNDKEGSGYFSGGYNDESNCNCPDDRPIPCKCHEGVISTCTGVGNICYQDIGKL